MTASIAYPDDRAGVIEPLRLSYTCRLAAGLADASSELAAWLDDQHADARRRYSLVFVVFGASPRG